jgi:autotransporter translocation and assembly factor TamB
MSFARRSLQVVALICTLLVGVTAMALIVSQTTWFRDWLRGFIVRQAEGYVNGQLSIGRLDGNLFYGIELGDVGVTMNGQPAVSVKQVGLDYNVFTLISGHVVLDHIRLDRPVLHLVKTAQGWNLAQLIKARTPNTNPNRQALEIGEIGISDGTMHIEGADTAALDLPARIERLDASVGVKSDEQELRVEVTHVSFRAVDPQLGLNALSGVIHQTKSGVRLENVAVRTEETSLRVDGTIDNLSSEAPVVDLKASSDKFTVSEIARLLPALRGYPLQPAFEVAATGPADNMAVTLNVRDAALGTASGDLTVDAIAPAQRVAGNATVEHLNLAVIAKSETLKSDISGHARFDLALPSDKLPLSGTYAVDASQVAVAGYQARNVVADGRIDGSVIRVNARADAYGAHATAQGTVKTGEMLALDLKGRAAGLDLRNLPRTLAVPRVPSNLQLAYSISGRGPVFSGTATMEKSMLAGATIAAGTTGQFKVGAGAPTYSARGEVANVDLQQIGRGFAIPALAVPKFHSTINTTFDVTGSGGGRFPLAIDASGSATDAELFGATFPRLDYTTKLAGGDIHATAIGQFANLDPAVVAENQQLAGKLQGAVDVTTTIRNYAAGVTADSIDVSGRVNLGHSTIGDLTVENGVVDGQYANRAGNLNQLSLVGPDVNVTGHGPIALNETGDSNLTLHIESPSLDRIGKIVNQPLTGSAIVDATVNGNARELTAYGTLTGSNLGQGENRALGVTSNFDVSIPQLEVAKATVHANTFATFAQIAGQQINQIDADTTYSNSQLYFSLTALQPERQLTVGGTATLHPDHQEVHLPDLVMRSGMIEWRTAPGAAASIQYSADRIGIENLNLVNGDQRISANGVLGTGQTLRVQAENVDVAQLNQLALRDPQQVAGRFTGTAVVTGPTSAPQVAADFTLSQGAFQTFKFESLAGKVNYEPRGLTLDVKLQQTAANWLTAKGFAPMSLFQATPPEISGHQTPAPGPAIDIQVASSAIDLGVIQGFTSYVSNVTGTLQANFTVTGSGNDPHLDGAIDLKGGAFTVPDLGTSYTGLDTRIELQPEVVRVTDMRVVDNHGSAMVIGGQLAVHARSVGEVNVNMKSQDFKVIDNELGNLRIDTDLNLTGSVTYPRVEGMLNINTGTINIAAVLAQVTAKAYSTEATELPLEDPAAAAERVRRNGEVPAEADSKVPGSAANPETNTAAVNEAAAAAVTPVTTPPPQTSLFDAMYVNLTIGIPDDLVLKGQDIKAGGGAASLGDANVTVGGNIFVTKAQGDVVRLTGDVNTIRGTYTFQGRRFDLSRDGRIRFTGNEQIDPLLDIEASRLISGVQAFVHVRGTMSKPELSFRSNPPLEEADVLSLIVFNQPINELGEGQQASLAQRAGGLASGYLASGLSRSIGNALNLNEFEIQAAGENGSGPSVQIGQQIGKNLFFRLRQGFGNASETEFILEYQLSRLLRLQATAAQVGGGAERVQFRRVERGGLDLIFFFAY